MQVDRDLSRDPFGFLSSTSQAAQPITIQSSCQVDYLAFLQLAKLPGAYQRKPNGRDFTVQKHTGRNRRKYLLIFRSLRDSSEELDRKHYPLESRWTLFQGPQNASSYINSTHWEVMGFPLGSKTIFLWMLHKRNPDAQVKYAINIQSNDHCDISSRITHNYKIISLLQRGSSPYANFTTANFITAIFQNFPHIQLMQFLANFISLLRFLCYKQNIEKISPKNALGKDPLYTIQPL